MNTNVPKYKKSKYLQDLTITNETDESEDEPFESKSRLPQNIIKNKNSVLNA